MKKLIIFTAALTLLLASCSGGTNHASTIEDTFTATVSHTEEGDKYLTVVKNSGVLDTLTPAVSAGAVALLAYNNLEEDKRNKFQVYDIEIHNSYDDKKSKAFYFQKEQMATFTVKNNVFIKFIDATVNGDSGELRSLCDPKFINDGQLAIVGTEFDLMENAYGSFKGSRTVGLSAVKSDAGEALYQYQGYLDFYDKSVFFFVNFKSEEDNHLITGYRFMF